MRHGNVSLLHLFEVGRGVNHVNVSYITGEHRHRQTVCMNTTFEGKQSRSGVQPSPLNHAVV